MTQHNNNLLHCCLFKSPIDNFKSSPQRILFTDKTETPHGSDVVMRLTHEPFAIL